MFIQIKKLALLLTILALVGCKANTPEPRLLGKPELTLRVASVKELGTLNKQKMTIKGEIVEKCPTAGCWFDLKDGTGTVRVDTKTAGFVISEIPLHTKMTVSGTVSKGNLLLVKATGIAY